MNFIKIGILSFAFLFTAAFTLAQSETVPVLYGDKGGLEPGLNTEDPVVEVVNEAPAPEIVSEEFPSTVVSESATTSEDTGGSKTVWYWTIGAPLVVIAVWVFLVSRRGAVAVA